MSLATEMAATTLVVGTTTKKTVLTDMVGITGPMMIVTLTEEEIRPIAVETIVRANQMSQIRSDPTIKTTAAIIDPATVTATLRGTPAPETVPMVATKTGNQIVVITRDQTVATMAAVNPAVATGTRRTTTTTTTDRMIPMETRIVAIDKTDQGANPMATAIPITTGVVAMEDLATETTIL